MFFHINFWLIYLTNLFVINSKLNVFYFLVSTTLLSFKLYVSFLMILRKDPGVLKKSTSLNYADVLKNVP